MGKVMAVGTGVGQRARLALAFSCSSGHLMDLDGCRSVWTVQSPLCL